MNRAITFEGCFEITSDEKIDVIIECPHTPDDRLYRMTVGACYNVSKEMIEAIIRGESGTLSPKNTTSGFRTPPYRRHGGT